jgi:hypothetical protein
VGRSPSISNIRLRQGFGATRPVAVSHSGRCQPPGSLSSSPSSSEGAGRVKSAVGSTGADLAISDARLHAPRDWSFFPARVRGVVATHQAGDAARGLSSKPCAGSVVQGLRCPWALRFTVPGGNASPVRFASQPDAGLQALELAGPRPSRECLLAGLLRPDTDEATPTNALTS